MNDERYLSRGKRLDTGEWVEGYILPTQDGRVCINYKDCLPIFNCSAGITFSHIIGNVRPEVDPATLGRCTGLRDKHGTPIFEGDILTLDNRYHPSQGYESTIVIVWDKCGFCYRYPKEKDLRYTPTIKTNTTFHIDEYELGKFAEIIGNIWDNSELMEVGE